jgi:hypothetical protein
MAQEGIDHTVSVAAEEQVSPFWAALGWFFHETPVGYAFSHTTGTFFNFVFAHILFWAIAFPTAYDYGYSDDSRDDNGALPSGTRGSGAVVMITIMFFLANIMFFIAFVRSS